MIIIDHFTGRIRDGSLGASHEGFGSDFSPRRDLTRTASSDATQYHRCRDQSSTLEVDLHDLRSRDLSRVSHGHADVDGPARLYARGVL